MTMLPSSHDVIVVGSGPGGAAVARDLSRLNRDVLILEQGSAAPLDGTLAQMAAIAAVPGKGTFINRDGSLLVRGIATGGSSAINYATAMPPPLQLFARYGVDLLPSLTDLQAELPMLPLPDYLVGPAATRILQSAQALGYDWQKFNKMIYSDKCRVGCWRCSYGCPFGAKWTARNMIDEAIDAGAQLQSNAKVQRVIIQDGCATGVEYSQNGQSLIAHAAIVVLAAGGIASPRLLHASGLTPGKDRHFSDPVIMLMGSIDDLDGGAEVPMAAGMHLQDEGIMLSDLTLPKALYAGFAAQVGRFDRITAHRRTLAIMVKIRDKIGGSIGPRWVNKSLHPSDKKKFNRGLELAGRILSHVGANHVFKSWHFAAHPGGSVRIGHGVDSDLRTAIPNLYVCDASVIPEEWGLPPTLTLLCLGKRLAAHLE